MCCSLRNARIARPSSPNLNSSAFCNAIANFIDTSGARSSAVAFPPAFRRTRLTDSCSSSSRFEGLCAMRGVWSTDPMAVECRCGVGLICPSAATAVFRFSNIFTRLPMDPSFKAASSVWMFNCPLLVKRTPVRSPCERFKSNKMIAASDRIGKVNQRSFHSQGSSLSNLLLSAGCVEGSGAAGRRFTEPSGPRNPCQLMAGSSASSNLPACSQHISMPVRSATAWSASISFAATLARCESTKTSLELMISNAATVPAPSRGELISCCNTYARSMCALAFSAKR